MKTILYPLLCFGAAFAFGWFGLRDSPDSGDEASAGGVASAGRARSTPESLTAERILARAAKDAKRIDLNSESEFREYQKRVTLLNERYKKRSGTFVLGDDPGSQYLDAFERMKKNEGDWSELRCVIGAWLDRDPDGYFKFQSSLLAEQRDRGNLGNVLAEKIGGMSLEDALRIVGMAKDQFAEGSYVFAPSLIKKAFETGGLEKAIEIRALLPSEMRRQLTEAIVQNCPEESKPAAFKWLVDNDLGNQIFMLAAHVPDPSKPYSYKTDETFLKRMIERYPDTRDKLIQSGQYVLIMNGEWEKLPLDQRLDAMVDGGFGKGGEEERRNAAAAYCCNTLANRLLESGTSSLKPSEITSREDLLKHLGGNAAELLERHPNEFWNAVFPNLATQNPEAAQQIASDLPQARKGELLAKAGGSWMIQGQGDAARLYEMFTAIPYERGQGPLQNRYVCWQKVTANAYNRYGDSYVDWLCSLPKGVEREMAMSALSHTVKTSDPDLSARLQVEKLQGNSNP